MISRARRRPFLLLKGAVFAFCEFGLRLAGGEWEIGSPSFSL
jgi:hypothetical protein